MKITCTLLSLCCCILFLSTFTKGEPPATKKGDIGDMGEKLPFCPTDKKTAKQIQEIIAILNQSTTSQVQLSLLDSKKELRRVRSISSCIVELPPCFFVSLRVNPDDGETAVNIPMMDCCSGCSDGYVTCVSEKKICANCINTWTSCMNECTVLHFCSFFSGWKGVKGSGPTVDGIKGSTQPIANLCPTEKVKNGGSYCIKRSCYPIRV